MMQRIPVSRIINISTGNIHLISILLKALCFPKIFFASILQALLFTQYVTD